MLKSPLEGVDAQPSPEVVDVDVFLLSLKDKVLDEPFPLTGLRVVGRCEERAHRVAAAFGWVPADALLLAGISKGNEAWSPAGLCNGSRDALPPRLSETTYDRLGGWGGGGGSRRALICWFCKFLFFSRLMALKLSSNPRRPEDKEKLSNQTSGVFQEGPRAEWKK